MTTAITNFSICTFSTPDRELIQTVTNISKQKYCRLHNLQYEFYTLTEFDKHPAWYKLDYILSMFDKYERLYFLDDDAGFCKYDTDFTQFLSLEHDVNLAITDGAMNTGSFSIVKNDRTIAALKYAATLYEKYKDDVFYEQTALIEAFKHCNVSINVVDNTLINASICTKTSDTIILHLMGGIKNCLKLSFLERIYDLY